jgi:putative chitinase
MSLIALQKKLGLTADGAFGPKTLKAAATHFKLSNVRAAHFFGQVAHETGEFRIFTENLNYSAEGLLKTFGKYFNATTAKAYARKPEMIANRVYGGRMGNGPEASGDGWKFRGRGAIQLTGQDNYEAFSKALSKPEILSNPDIVATDYSFESALHYFNTRAGLWDACDAGVTDRAILAVTKKVNGGTNGLDHREKLTKQYFGWLAGS